MFRTLARVEEVELVDSGVSLRDLKIGRDRRKPKFETQFVRALIIARIRRLVLRQAAIGETTVVAYPALPVVEMREKLGTRGQVGPV